MTEAMQACYANASAPHLLGRQAHDLLEASRAVVAESLGADPEEVYFTSGGTEANNLAIGGAHGAACPERDLLVTTALEHPSVTKAARDLKRRGFPVRYCNAPHGELDLQQLAEALSGGRVALVSVMAVQNVFGYLFPLDEVARLRDQLSPDTLLHSDAVQAYGKLLLRPAEQGIELLSVSGHKIGGPKGVGALYVRAGTRLFATAFGGGQERGLRSGTEAVPQIAGFAEAVRITFGRRHESLQRMRDLRQRLLSQLESAFAGVVVNSRPDGIPSIVHFSLPGTDNDRVVSKLGERGVYVGISAACDTNHIRPNEPIRAKHPTVALLAGVRPQLERSSYRVSLSAQNTNADIDALVTALKEVTPYG